MSKKSKKRSKVRQNYLPIVVLNNNVKSGKKKVSSSNSRRKIYHRYSDDGAQFTNDKDTVVYIQNYPPPGTAQMDIPFERRSGPGVSYSSSGSTALQPYISTSDMSSYQVPVASASSGYGGGGGCGGGGCGQELSLFEGLIFLAALGAAVYFLNLQIIMFIGKKRRKLEGESDFMSSIIPWSKYLLC